MSTGVVIGLQWAEDIYLSCGRFKFEIFIRQVKKKMPVCTGSDGWHLYNDVLETCSWRFRNGMRHGVSGSEVERLG